MLKSKHIKYIIAIIVIIDIVAMVVIKQNEHVSVDEKKRLLECKKSTRKIKDSYTAIESQSERFQFLVDISQKVYSREYSLNLSLSADKVENDPAILKRVSQQLFTDYQKSCEGQFYTKRRDYDG